MHAGVPPGIALVPIYLISEILFEIDNICKRCGKHFIPAIIAINKRLKVRFHSEDLKSKKINVHESLSL